MFRSSGKCRHTTIKPTQSLPLRSSKSTIALSCHSFRNSCGFPKLNSWESTTTVAFDKRRLTLSSLPTDDGGTFQEFGDFRYIRRKMVELALSFLLLGCDHRR